MNDIHNILNKIKLFLLNLGFKESTVNGVTNYVYGNTHCIPHHIQSLGFLIEYADSYADAQKNWYEDGDVFPLDMGEGAILAGLKEEILRDVLKK